jgi:hypothetical protein
VEVVTSGPLAPFADALMGGASKLTPDPEAVRRPHCHHARCAPLLLSSIVPRTSGSTQSGHKSRLLDYRTENSRFYNELPATSNILTASHALNARQPVSGLVTAGWLRALLTVQGSPGPTSAVLSLLEANRALVCAGDWLAVANMSGLLAVCFRGEKRAAAFR